jgi:squalene-hopene/tetraprenyl-beta-curcumene cyclase
MTHSLFPKVHAVAVCIVLLGPLAFSASAVRPFQDEFQANYPGEQSGDPDETTYAAPIRGSKCSLCHADTNKKDCNTCSMKLVELSDHGHDRGSPEKIGSVFTQVARVKSEPNDSPAKTSGDLVAAHQLATKTPPAPAPSLDDVARPDEPLRDKFSLHAAVVFLDNAALTWQRDRKCFACHSNYTFLETRPLISWKTPVHTELRAKLEELGANPRHVRFRVMEGVMAACVLAQNDALTTSTLHPVTRQALDYMWTLQSEDGSFDWEKSSQPPSEVDDHFGATMAVIGVGVAPEGYAATPAAQAGLNKIRQYLKNNPPANLHQRSMLLLGALHVDGIMTEAERKAVVDDLFAVQKRDGGWGIVSLGNWKRHDGKQDDTESSDGYGTGFVIYVLRQAGVPADDLRIQAGVAWLKANQRISGRWFTRSQWEDSRHYLSRLGTAYAIRALVACGERGEALFPSVP